MKSASHRFGTRVVGSIDLGALREGIASPGMDTRYWVSLGTVGTIDNQGDFHPDDPHAVWNGPEGVECDVKLEPLEQMVVALWGAGGDVADISPIHPGDQVVVECPGGDPSTPPVITRIIHSRSNKQPMTSGVPIFDNHRRLIYARQGVVDIRTAGGVQLLLNQDGTAVLKCGSSTQIEVDQDGTVTVTGTRINDGGSDAAEQGVLGTSYRGAEDQLFDQLQQGVSALQAAAVGPLAALQPGFTTMNTALIAFKASALAQGGFLSNRVFLKK